MRACVRACVRRAVDRARARFRYCQALGAACPGSTDRHKLEQEKTTTQTTHPFSGCTGTEPVILYSRGPPSPVPRFPRVPLRIPVTRGPAPPLPVRHKYLVLAPGGYSIIAFAIEVGVRFRAAGAHREPLAGNKGQGSPYVVRVRRYATGTGLKHKRHRGAGVRGASRDTRVGARTGPQLHSVTTGGMRGSGHALTSAGRPPLIGPLMDRFSRHVLQDVLSYGDGQWPVHASVRKCYVFIAAR